MWVKQACGAVPRHLNSIGYEPRSTSTLRKWDAVEAGRTLSDIKRTLDGGREVTRVLKSSTAAERLERVKGIEPSSEAWEAPALPLSYTRAPRMISDPRQPASGLPCFTIR